MTYRFEFTDEIGDKVITVPTGTKPQFDFDFNWALSLPDYYTLYVVFYLVHPDGTLENLTSNYLFWMAANPYLEGHYFISALDVMRTLEEEGDLRFMFLVSPQNTEQKTITTKKMYITVQYRNINEYDVYTGTEYKQ